MKTISAKELRDNLDSIVRRVRSGEAIKVTYRNQPAFTLQPEALASSEPEPGSAEAMEKFIADVRKLNSQSRQSTLDPNKSIKELYHQMLDEDPKYKGIYD